MTSILTIDVGNTNIKYGFFEDARLAKTWHQNVDITPAECLETIASVQAPVALASVVPVATEMIRKACESLGRRLFIVGPRSQHVLSGMNEHMGADRVADAVAAYKLHGNSQRPVMIVGFGTATTLLAITADGHVAGGWIAPGLVATLESLHERCALLPLLKMEGHTEFLGFDTESHMRNGVFLGHVGLVREWLDAGEKQLSSGAPTLRPLKIATGGAAQLIDNYAHVFDVVDSALTLKGVYLIAEAAGGAVSAGSGEIAC